MSTLTKEWLQQTIAELEEERDAVPGAVNEDAAMALAAMKLALASLDTEAVGYIDAEYAEILKSGHVESCSVYAESGEGCFPVYTAPPAPVSVPDALPENDDEEGNDIDYMEPSEVYAFGRTAGWNACRAAMLQGADEKPELTVWYGSMPESNGKANWTAILHRKGEGRCMDGFTIDRSEYPGRVLYAADRVRYLIGEKSERPSILDYDADAHSGYVKTGNSPVIPDGWVAFSERMPEESGRYWCYVEEQNDLGKSHYQWNCAWNGKRWWVEHEGGGRVTHWQLLPSPPQK